MTSQHLLDLLAKNEFDQIFDVLKSLSPKLNSGLRNQITLVEGQYNGYQKDLHSGTVSQEHLGITLNKIRSALSYTIGEIPDDVFPVENTSSTHEGYQPKTEGGAGRSAKPASNLPWILGLVLLFGGVSFLLFVKCPTEPQFFAIRLLLALGAAGIGTLIPGALNLEGGAMKAAGPLALAVLIFLVNPAKMVASDCGEKNVGLTVFVHGKKGTQDMILRQQGHVLLDVEGERKKQSIDENGKAQFARLNVGDQIRLNVDFSEPYRAIYPDSIYKVDNSGKIYLEVALEGLEKISGTVIFNDQPLPGVLVSIGTNLVDTTNASGTYHIDIPESEQRKEQEVKFIKSGFKMKMERALPQSGEPLNVVMEKID